MQKWPFSKLRKFLPILRQRWFSKLDLSEYDLVISSSGAEAKGINTVGKTIHINYCHSPTHYYWSRYDEYIQSPGFGSFDFLARFGLKIFIDPMRRWDYKAAQKPDYIVANSTYIQKKIKEYYDRESVVIHPPVDTKFFKPNSQSLSSNFIVVGRQTPYKKIELPVLACSALSLPLTVIGNGPDHKNLVSVAGNTIKFIKNASRERLATELSSAKAFIFPGLDDFGISAVEALASGIPVIAYRDGGALDYVIPGKTGQFFNQQSIESLSEALKRFDSNKFDGKDLIEKAQEFSDENFRRNFIKFLEGITK